MPLHDTYFVWYAIGKKQYRQCKQAYHDIANSEDKLKRKIRKKCSNQNINNLLICKYRMRDEQWEEISNYIFFVFLLTNFDYWFLFCARALYSVQPLRLFCLLKNKYLFNMFNESISPQCVRWHPFGCIIE